MSYITITKETCKGCGLCIKVCPKNVIEIGSETNKSGYNIAVPARNENCIGCALCAAMCPDVAITVDRE
jgi:Dissimilatory sulfite reductase (desulfoviridin), alpha and beta subunits